MEKETLRRLILVCSVVSCTLNTALIPIVILRSSADMGSYKYLILAYTLVELIYSIFSILLLPFFVFSSTEWIFYGTTSILPQWLATYVVCAYTASYLMLYIILVYSFLYRYFVFCKPDSLIWFKSTWRVAFLVGFVIVSCSIYYTLMYTMGGNDPYIAQKYQYAHFSTLQYFNLSVNGYVGVSLKDAKGHVSVGSIVVFSQWIIAISVMTCIIVFVVIQMIRKFREFVPSETMTSQLQKYQRTLFIVLLLQTIVPTLFSFIPVLTSFFIPLMPKIDASLFTATCSIFLPLAQLLDPILILFVIKDYRMTIIGLLNCTRRIVSGASKNTNVSSGLALSDLATTTRVEHDNTTTV